MRCLLRVLEHDENGIRAVRQNVSIRLSSSTTSATHPLGRQRTKATRPISLPSTLRPSPLGSSTPSGPARAAAGLRGQQSAGTITDRPTLGWSSAMTFWMIAHCSKLARAACRSSSASRHILRTHHTLAKARAGRAQGSDHGKGQAGQTTLHNRLHSVISPGESRAGARHFLFPTGTRSSQPSPGNAGDMRSNCGRVEAHPCPRGTI